MSEEAALLAALPALAFHAALLFCRLGAAVMLLPGIGEAEIPATQRLALGLGLVLALLPALSPALPPPPADVGTLARLVVVEVALGLWFGLLTRILAIALAQAGQVIALMIGLSSPLAGDQVLGGAATSLARMLALLAATLVLATGLHEGPLRALVHSYEVLPAGRFPAGAAAEEVAAAAARSLALSLQLAAPFVLAAVLFNAALGLLARLAPQSQVFVIGAPIQIIGGFLLLALLLPVILALWAAGMGGSFALLPGAR